MRLIIAEDILSVYRCGTYQSATVVQNIALENWDKLRCHGNTEKLETESLVHPPKQHKLTGAVQLTSRHENVVVRCRSAHEILV